MQTQKDAGKSDADIKTMLSSYDQWDRNDFDHDGNFNEPDGYIDHFQIVHAGGDQADGDPIQGEDAIWSHRWKAYQSTGEGPTGNKDGGTQIGNTGLWVADYTVQPENGGVSVFAHEYTHDLGLPDLYDTSGPSSANENGVNYWSLMAQSREAGPNDVGIGTRASDLGAWDKLQLGWLDYEIVNPRTAGDKVALGPHEYNSAKAQAAVVNLPKKQVTTTLSRPVRRHEVVVERDRGRLRRHHGPQRGPAGRHVDPTSRRSGTSRTAVRRTPATTPTSRSTTGPAGRPSPGNITKPAENNGIDGSQTTWTPATFDLSAYAGKTVGLRLHYKTDPAAAGNDGTDQVPGLFADEIKVTNGANTLFTSGAEASPEGWTLAGF